MTPYDTQSYHMINYLYEVTRKLLRGTDDVVHTCHIHSITTIYCVNAVCLFACLFGAFSGIK